jgi:hypothetical protein
METKPMMIAKNNEKIIIALILAAGVFLSLLQFLFNRSLWLDEAWLSLNIINKSSLDLLKPLDYNQVAPILFLQIEKLFSTILPNSEYGLRIFPLLCYWGAICFFYKIIKMRLHNVYAIIIALSLFVFNPTFMFYSSDAKQYMTDVMVLLAVFYFVLKDYKKETNKYYVLGAVGVIAILISNVAPIILFVGGLCLLYDPLFVSKNKKILPLFAVFAVWVSTFLLYYAFFIYNHPAKEFMVKFWASQHENAFFNIHKGSGLFLIEKMEMIFRILSCRLFLPLSSAAPFPNLIINKYILMLLSLTGFVIFIRERKMKLIILTCAPIIMHLFLSGFHLYPFESKFILYTLPCFIISCSEGFGFIIKIIFSSLKIKKVIPFAIVIPIFFFLSGYPVKIEREEIKKSIRYIQENIHEGENIYIYYFATFPYKYYDNIGFTNLKTPIIEGKYNRSGFYSTGDINELKRLRGKTWLLLSSDKGIAEQVNSLGYKKIKEYKAKGSFVYLYDFGNGDD